MILCLGIQLQCFPDLSVSSVDHNSSRVAATHDESVCSERVVVPNHLEIAANTGSVHECHGFHGKAREVEWLWS